MEYGNHSTNDYEVVNDSNEVDDENTSNSYLSDTPESDDCTGNEVDYMNEVNESDEEKTDYAEEIYAE